MEEKELRDFIESEQRIVHRAPCSVFVGEKEYKVKQISNAVRTRISLLEKEVYLLEEEGKNGLPIRKAKKVDKILRRLHAKTAAYYLLGNKAIFMPLRFYITWHRLDLLDSEHTFRINEAGMNNKGLDFFLANWQITKAQLVLSTRLVGEGLKDFAERKESAESMLAKDGLETKPDAK